MKKVDWADIYNHVNVSMAYSYITKRLRHFLIITFQFNKQKLNIQIKMNLSIMHKRRKKSKEKDYLFEEIFY